MGRRSSYFVCDTFILSYLIYERWSLSVCFTLSAFHDQSQSAAKEVEIIVFPFLSFWILLYLYFRKLNHTNFVLLYLGSLSSYVFILILMYIYHLVFLYCVFFLKFFNHSQTIPGLKLHTACFHLSANDIARTNTYLLRISLNS